MADQVPEWVSEEDLAVELKVDRQVLRHQRPHLGAGEVDQKSGAVVWLRSAATRVAAKLGLTLAEQEKTAPAVNGALPDGVEVLTVVSQALNRNIVNATRPSGERVCVRVMDNKKYLPRTGKGEPMTLRAKKSTAGNWWILVGREPRWPGMW